MNRGALSPTSYNGGTKRGANLATVGPNFFGPSPAANLVGAMKKDT